MTASSCAVEPHIKLRETVQGVVVSTSGVAPLVRADRAGVVVVTDRLSSRGARRIFDACYFCLRAGRPFAAMWTFTVAAEHRGRFLDGGETVSAHLRRALDQVRKSYGSFDYVWVAECPGGENLHVHLLTNLVVPRQDFAELAASVERYWALGFVHIERLRVPEGAAAYILKAAGYIGKGAGRSQGLVYGRRYGISRGLNPEAEVRVQCLDRAGWHRYLRENGDGVRAVHAGASAIEITEHLRGLALAGSVLVEGSSGSLET